MKQQPPQQLHIPVLLEQTLAVLAPQLGDTYLDLTAGYGGHARAVLERTQAPHRAVLVDRDEFAHAHLGFLAEQGAKLIRSDFRAAAGNLAREGRVFDMILIDLGVSSPQLDNMQRGFSIKHDGPLDMRMDNRQQETAATIINSYTTDQLAQVIETYGEESSRDARRIAEAIVAARPLTTTHQLAEIVKHALRHKGWSKIHPATRTFQALRIELNQELAQLEQTLPLLPQLLKPGGRVAIISFHSLEDRLVKRFLAEEASAGYEAKLQLITKKAIRGATEDVHNPRARSAVLRAAVKK